MPKIIKKHTNYIPTKPIWLIFDCGNGHEGSRRYVWWFDTKKEAKYWSKRHIKENSKFGYDISLPIKFKRVKVADK